MEQPGRVSPVRNPSVELQSQAIVTPPVDQSSVTAQGVNESGLESVSKVRRGNSECGAISYFLTIIFPAFRKIE